MGDYHEIVRGEFDGTDGGGGVFFPFVIPETWKPGDTVRIHIRGVFGPMILGIEHLGNDDSSVERMEGTGKCITQSGLVAERVRGQ